MRSRAGAAEAGPARIVAEVARRIRLVGYATPTNLRAELARVGAVWARGGAEAPRFVYLAAPELSAERAALARAIDAVEGWTGQLVAARARELMVEARACEAVGTAAFWGLARERYARRDAWDEGADELASEWVGGPDGGGPEASAQGAGGREDETVATDDGLDPRSLVNAMRRAVGERRLGFRVVVSRELAPLAATGDAVIFVAAGRRATAADTARTVLHEVEGHAMPAARARQAALPLLQIGTAFGADDQEGRALLVEERAGVLGVARRRELSLRHLAARTVEARADFADTARLLLRHGARPEDALRIAARVHRGGGLARETAYLPALLRVRAALAEAPALEGPLGSGRVSVEAARLLLAQGVVS